MWVQKGMSAAFGGVRTRGRETSVRRFGEKVGQEVSICEAIICHIHYVVSSLSLRFLLWP